MKHIVDATELESGWMVLKGHDPNRRMAKGTLVIGDERVFTESELSKLFTRLRSQFFQEDGAGLLHDFDFEAEVAAFLSDPA